MITDNKVLEAHAHIIDTFDDQGVAVYFKIVDGSHQCCLAFDDRVLFEGSDIDALQLVFVQWCDELDKSELGKYIAPF